MRRLPRENVEPVRTLGKCKADSDWTNSLKNGLTLSRMSFSTYFLAHWLVESKGSMSDRTDSKK